MLESFDFRGHFCLVFDLLGMSMYDFLRCMALAHEAERTGWPAKPVPKPGRFCSRLVPCAGKTRIVHSRSQRFRSLGSS